MYLNKLEVFVLELVLGNKKITLEDLINVTRRGYKVKISDEAYEKIDKARKLVDKYVEEGKVSYGITTGFGKFAEVSISKEQTGQLQKNMRLLWKRTFRWKTGCISAEEQRI